MPSHEQVEDLKEKNKALEERLNEQLRIRGELEEAFRNARYHIDGLEHQLEAFKKEPARTVAVVEEPTPGLKAVNTKLKMRVKALEDALAVAEKNALVRPVPEVQTRTISVPTPVLDKGLLLEWSRALKLTLKGDASGYPKLLEIADKYGMDIPTVLSILK